MHEKIERFCGKNSFTRHINFPFVLCCRIVLLIHKRVINSTVKAVLWFELIARLKISRFNT